MGAFLYLPETDLKKQITVHVKTFFGARLTFKFDLDVQYTIQQLKNLIVDASGENAKSFYNLRLIYPMGMI